MSEKRPSPSESATLFKIGTIKKGNDNNLWIISENKNGVKHWKKHTVNKSTTVIKNDIIVEFKLNTIGSFKKVGRLPIESNVVVGEFDYEPSNGFPKFKKGTYYIYRVDDNLVLSSVDITRKNILDTLWKDTGNAVGVDGGTFGFWDVKFLKALAKFDKSNRNNIPLFTNIWDKKNTNDTIIIRIKNFDDAKKYIDYGLDGEKIVGVISPTGTGDGVFGCYSNGNNTALLLLGGVTSMELYEETEEQMPVHLDVVKKHKIKKSRKPSKKTSRKPSKKTSKKIKKPSRKTSRTTKKKNK